MKRIYSPDKVYGKPAYVSGNKPVPRERFNIYSKGMFRKTKSTISSTNAVKSPRLLMSKLDRYN